MDSFFELARQRRSVRAYLQDKAVPNDILYKVLETARLAPSAKNSQPWVYIVVRDSEVKEQLRAVYDREWFLQAPVIIAVCCDRNESWIRSDGKDFGDIDCAIAMDHLTLAATSFGLGTCWIGAFNNQRAREVLGLPNTIEPVVLSPLGYPAVTETPRRPGKPLDSIVYWERYSR